MSLRLSLLKECVMVINLIGYGNFFASNNRGHFPAVVGYAVLSCSNSSPGCVTTPVACLTEDPRGFCTPFRKLFSKQD